MCDTISSFSFDKESVLGEDFYKVTKINLMYNRRRLFQNVKGKISYNIHFPMDQARASLSLFCLYLNYSNTTNSETADYDYDIGFNNCEINIEEQIIEESLKNYDVFYLLRTDNIKEFDSINDLSVYSKDNICITKCSNENLQSFFRKLNKSICGYLFSPKGKSVDIVSFYYNAIDLSSWQNIADIFEIALLRVPIYANYNLMLCAKEAVRIDRLRECISTIISVSTTMQISQGDKWK